MSVLHYLASLGLVHLVIIILFDALILCLFIRAILSFFPMISPANRFVRFFTNVVGPVYDPVYRLLPRISVSMFDLSATVAFLFTWWALAILERLIVSSLPLTW